MKKLKHSQKVQLFPEQLPSLVIGQAQEPFIFPSKTVDAPYATTSISESDVTANAYVYSFTEVAFGTYPAISVSWEDPEDTNPATNQHIIGVYGGTAAAYFADADSITVSEDIYELTDLDFGADFGLVQP